MIAQLPRFMLLVFLFHSDCYCPARAQPLFWISEVFNSFSNFTDLFVEIYDGGHGNMSLKNVTLEIQKNPNESLFLPLGKMTTNSEGFLVLDFNTADQTEKSFLKNIQNETVTLKLNNSTEVNETEVIDVFKKKKGWSDVISCYRNASGVIATVLAGNKSKGKINDCPSSPVRLDLFILKSPFNFTIRLLSHSFDHFPLDNHVIDIFENSTLIQSISLQESTENKTRNVSFAISRTFNKSSVYNIQLKVKIKSKSFLLDSVYFGARSVASFPLNKTLQTYPDKNPARSVTPVYLKLDPSASPMFASCSCDISALTYNFFVRVKSLNLQSENCQKKCNTLISTSPTVTWTSSSSTSPTKVTVSSISTFNPSQTYSVDTSSNGYTTDLTTSTLTEANLMTLDVNKSSLSETTEKLTTPISTTAETQSSTELSEQTTEYVTNLTNPKLVTSTVPTTTELSILPLYINEVRVGLQSDIDYWIELKGNNSHESLSSYVLIHDVPGRTKSTTFYLNKLKTLNQKGLFYINFNIDGAGELLKDLNSKAGLLRVFNSKLMTDKNKIAGLSDCLAYQIEGNVLETKLANLCPLHQVKQITHRELDQDWTIGRCGAEFAVLEASANETNKCPSKKFSKPLYMKILKRKKNKKFKIDFLSSLVQKISADEGCMVSDAFFLDFSANKSKADINIHAVLAATNQTRLNALYMCYKTLFHKESTMLKLGSENVSVYKCHNDKYLLPTIKVAEASSGGKKALAFVIPILVVFVCLLIGFVIYMRYKRRSLLSVLGMTRYDADQDDLLVNMEDVGRLDTNFRNPTYSQLTVY